MNGQSYHQPMQCMPHYRYTRIKRYFFSTPTDQDQAWYKKLSPLYKHINTYIVQGILCAIANVSIDNMMKAFTGRSAHTLKMLNKSIKEGYKMWALADYGYTWHFLWHSRAEGMIKQLSFKQYFNANYHIRTAKFVKVEELSKTASVVLQLAKTLLYQTF